MLKSLTVVKNMLLSMTGGLECTCCQIECFTKGGNKITISVSMSRALLRVNRNFLNSFKITGVFKKMSKCYHCMDRQRLLSSLHTQFTSFFLLFLNCLICSVWSGMNIICTTKCFFFIVVFV